MSPAGAFPFSEGNTFVAIARETLVSELGHLSTLEQVAARGAIGHFIAGTIGMGELKEILHPPSLPPK